MAVPILGRFATIDAATIDSQSDEETGLPASNIQNMQPSKVWRAAPASANMYIVLDLGSAVAVNVVALFGTNVSSSASWRIWADADLADVQGASDPTGTDYDSTLINASPGRDLPSDWAASGKPVIHIPASTQTWRYWRIKISDSGNSDGYIQVGRILIDAAIRPAKQINFGWSWHMVDESPKARSFNGQVYTSPRPVRRRLEAQFGLLTEAQMFDDLAEIQRRVGVQKDVAFILNPDDTGLRLAQQTFHGLFEPLERVVNVPADYYNWTWKIEELV